MKNTFILLLLLLFLLLQSCKEDPPVTPPPPQPKLTLTVDDVSCTEAWLNLKLENVTLPIDLELKKDSIVIKTFFSINSNDTTLYVDILLPNQIYNLQVSSIQHPVSSNNVSVTTMDTTSHNLTFETWTFGEIGSSVLYDVAIIDENNIWAVGIIQTNDSLGNPDPHDYNAVHWDGNEWELLRIMFYTICGQPDRTSYPIKAIIAFNENEIWVGSDGRQIAKISGTTQVETICPPFSMVINKIWGTSGDDLYLVGNNGNVAHYNGSQWTKIESGTTSNIGDIWGIPDGNGNYNKYYSTGETMIVLDVGNEFTIINAGINNSVNLIWGISNNLVYTAGNGVVLYKNNGWEKINIAELNTVYGIKGNNHNNVFGISANSSIFHFNGYSWNNNNIGNNNIYYRLDVKNNLTAAVGWQGDKAAITLLKRNN